jgi:hypothetical protein
MCANFGFAALGGEPLAALRAATGNDAAAAFGRHAGAKPVPALAYEPARLIGAFHWKNLRWRLGVDWSSWIELPFMDCVGTRGADGLVGRAETQARRSKIPRLIREGGRVRQCEARPGFVARMSAAVSGAKSGSGVTAGHISPRISPRPGAHENGQCATVSIGPPCAAIFVGTRFARLIRATGS